MKNTDFSVKHNDLSHRDSLSKAILGVTRNDENRETNLLPSNFHSSTQRMLSQKASLDIKPNVKDGVHHGQNRKKLISSDVNSKTPTVVLSVQLCPIRVPSVVPLTLESIKMIHSNFHHSKTICHHNSEANVYFQPQCRQKQQKLR